MTRPFILACGALVRELRAVFAQEGMTDVDLAVPLPSAGEAVTLRVLGPDGDPVVGVFSVYHGPTAEGERVLAASCIRRPRDGMVVRTGSPRAFKAREMVFELLLADPARRQDFGAAGRRRASEAFSLDGMCENMEALYDELIELYSGGR